MVRENRGMKRSREPEEYEDEEAPSPSPGPDGASPTPAPAQAPPASAFQRARKIASVDPDGDDGGGAEDDASARAPAGQNDATATATAVMRCSLPPHRDVLAFKTYADYEVHYSKAHTNRCVECRRNLPSEHLLGVHIEECHDVFAALRRERGEHTVRAPFHIRTSLSSFPLCPPSPPKSQKIEERKRED